MIEQAWLDEGDTIIPEWFVNYWVNYREIIESIYPEIHKEIDTIVKSKMQKKSIKRNRYDFWVKFILMLFMVILLPLISFCLPAIIITAIYSEVKHEMEKNIKKI